MADAEAALAAAESKAVAEASIRQPEWLLPLALEVAGMILIAAGFGLGRKPVSVALELTRAQIAARKGLKTKRRNVRLREKARQIGPKLAVSR